MMCKKADELSENRDLIAIDVIKIDWQSPCFIAHFIFLYIFNQTLLHLYKPNSISFGTFLNI